MLFPRKYCSQRGNASISRKSCTCGVFVTAASREVALSVATFTQEITAVAGAAYDQSIAGEADQVLRIEQYALVTVTAHGATVCEQKH